ncbi:non-homologous end-joining DNA ligase [Pyxidicoccus trucidator]|uniref:non-homologous end-joining DNA ligase n=1 Tax=Pyxidicoccus trucidator TaxID=2709662 RepID=UPI001F0713BB|nr:non-homologous end-joining DNA ligase [Pyxidicoccus trucidator]
MNRPNARLQTYRSKRDFRLTPEPAPEAAARARKDGAPIFVVHKHDATRLHYDLRLEISGVLASWALPRGPSYDPGEKRLAVETEDHPLSYAGFEGHIPNDAYGGGDSLLWDRGTFDTVPPGQAEVQREKGRLLVELQGEKLKGRWHLIRTHLRGSGKKTQWLCFKAKDETAAPDYDVTEARPESVKSGQVKTRGPVKRGARKRAPEPAEEAPTGRTKHVAKGRKLAAPRTPEALLERVWPPMLARLSVPEEAGDATHVYEVKYDGFRAVAALRSGKLTFQSRRGNDLSARFPALAEALRGLDVHDVVLDGEIVALDPKGRSRFQLLQNQAGVEQRYVLFDVLWLDGEDLRQLPLEERRARLEKLLKGVKLPLQVSERVELPLGRALATAQRRGWEGLIAKRKGSPYVGTRSADWLKLKVLAGQEVVILGYLPIQNERAKTELGALLVGVHDEGGFRDIGKVGTGFSSKDRSALRQLLDKDRVSKPMAMDAEPRKGAVWVRPRHVAQVQFTEWTEDGRLRHPVYQGLRTDKRPVEVVREQPAPVARQARKREDEAKALPDAARRDVRPVREGTTGGQMRSTSKTKRAAGRDGSSPQRTPKRAATNTRHTPKRAATSPRLAVERDTPGSQRTPKDSGPRTRLAAVRDTPGSQRTPKRATADTRRAPARAATGTRRAPAALAARTAAVRGKNVEAETGEGRAKLTHGDRVLFPDSGLTKADVFAYYREVAPLMVPVLADRPISVQQWPAGIKAPGFFRHELSGIPDWVPTLSVRHEEKTLRHVNVKDEEPLLWLANQSALTLHMWLSRAPRLAQPDMLVLDLDPGKGGWADVVTVAMALREKLEAHGLRGYPKTSGKRGLHVVVPLAPGHTYARTQAFANRLVSELEVDLGDISTTQRSIDKRGGRLYLDAGQNARGKTVVAPYSLRAKDGAPFSAPVKWSEVTKQLDPARFNLKTFRKRLDSVGDLFAEAMKDRQTLPE